MEKGPPAIPTGSLLAGDEVCLGFDSSLIILEG